MNRMGEQGTGAGVLVKALEAPRPERACFSSAASPAAQDSLQALDQDVRVWTRRSGSGPGRQGMDQEVRVWTRTSRSGPGRQGLDQDVRVWTRTSGSGPGGQGLEGCCSYLLLYGFII